MDDRDVIEALLNELPGMFATSKATEPAFGAAVHAGYLATKETGGRVITFLTGMFLVHELFRSFLLIVS